MMDDKKKKDYLLWTNKNICVQNQTQEFFINKIR